ncbi:MAG: inorganic diphosphatase [Thermomicrobia bacterium]|nr:inorganic diphosphatase [Thermomicrobia bacterium]
MGVRELPPRAKDGAVNVVVEIPCGSRNKYEYDPALDVIALDRTLYSAVHFPTDYGFVPGTKASDGDPVDALVMVEEPTFPGCLVRVRLIGLLTIDDGKGAKEPKLLAVPVNEPRFAEYHDIADVPKHLLKEIENFFDIYKQLEGKTVKSRGWQGAKQAEMALGRAITEG